MSKEFKVRDRRNKGWFYMDNDYLNGYAKIFGAVGTAIYVSLCRHADTEQKCFPSQELISEELNINEKTVRKYIALFEKHKLIKKEKTRTKEGKWLNNIYWLLDKTEWLLPKETITYGSHREITAQPSVNNDQNHRELLPINNTNINNTNNKNTHIAEHSSATKSPTNIQLLIEHFYKLKEWDKLNKTEFSEKNVIFKRFCRPAKELLTICENNLEEAKKKLTIISNWAKASEIDWGIETVFKRWFDLDFLPQERKQKPYYKGDPRFPMQFSKGKWWVITPQGEWKEFDQSQKEIIYR